MDKADLAIAISTVSAFAGIASASFAGWLAWNDSKRLRRQEPVFEFRKGHPSDRIAGWNKSTLTIRNLEDLAMVVTRVRTRKRHTFINSWDDASTGYDPGFGEVKFKDSLPEKRETTLNMQVSPKGTQPHPHGLTPGATTHFQCFTKGVDKSTDLKVSWRWADDQK